MRKFLLSLVISIITVSLYAQDTYNFTLEDCLNYAFQNNYNRQSMKLSEQVQQNTYDQSKMERIPNVNASLSEGWSSSKNNSSSWDGNYSINAKMPLYQGGMINKTVEQNKLYVEQSTYQTSQYDNELTIQILQSFLSVLGNQELLKYQQTVVEASSEQAKQGEEQFRVGSILESDYLLLEAQYANDLNNITDTQIARDNSLLTLKKLLSMPPSYYLCIIYPDTAAIEGMGILPPMDNVINQALNTLPDIKISQYNVDIANMSIKLAKSSFWPTLSLSGGVGTGHVNDYSSFGTQLSNGLNEQVGVSLSIPLYNNNRTKTKVEQSRIAMKQAELDKKQTELDVMQNVAIEYQDVVSSYNKYNTTNIRQNAYFKTFEAYRAQFNAGAITAVDLLQQQNNYISALNDYIQSKYSFILKRKILDVYMGVPVTI